MSRTYYWEKTHTKGKGWVTFCEQMQKNHIPLAVLWNPAEEKPYCIQYAGSGHYCEDLTEVLSWIAGHRPKLMPPEEVVKAWRKEVQKEREAEKAADLEEANVCERTIKSLIGSPAHMKDGMRDYDKVPFGTVEDAINLLQRYREMLGGD